MMASTIHRLRVCLGSGKTLFRGTVAYHQLVRPSPQGSSHSPRTGHIQLSLFWLGFPEGRRTKHLEYDRSWYRGGDLRDVPCTRVQESFGQTGQKKSRYEGATERACRSPTLFREDKAKRSTVFKVRRSSDISIGSKGGLQRASSTTTRSRGGTRDRTLGLSLITPWRKRAIRGS